MVCLVVIMEVNLVDKFKSRKFIMSVLATAVGVVTALTQMGGKIGTVCGIIAAILAPIVYVVVEGNIDEKAITLSIKAVEATKDGIEELKDGEDNVG